MDSINEKIAEYYSGELAARLFRNTDVDREEEDNSLTVEGVQQAMQRFLDGNSPVVTPY